MSKNGNLGDRTRLKVASSGPIELYISPPVDFDLADSILRVLEAWELGNKGLYRKYQAYNKIMKISSFYFGPESPKK